ncbi:MAG: pyridoxal phosphate-dependent aminotransferase [Patescibacteria group bacterium]|nr:pyridoxal phosphate-dependent aminotransferase [Patescibacteria group bacterium]
MANILSTSQRSQSLPSSPIRKLVPFADAAKKRGIKVYYLNIGDPDFATPQPVIRELKKVSADIKTVSYANSQGVGEHLKSWVKYYKDCGISITYDEINVTSGGSEALMFAVSATCDPNDEILVFEPYYANYFTFARLLNVKVVPIALEEKNAFHLVDKKQIEKKITKNTKAILFTNPNNPTGTVFSKKEIRIVLDLAVKHNLFIIADETYRGLCFDDKKSYSVLQVARKEETQRVIICDSLSKRLNICGARIGAIISKNTDVMSAVLKMAQARLSAGLIEQRIATPMLNNCLPYIGWLAKQYEKRRNTFLDTLENKLKLKIHRPEGAFYTMVRLPVKNTDEFAKWLLTDFCDQGETVMVAPGAGFYATPNKGKDEIRVAFVLEEKKLKRAAQLLSLAVKKY